MVADQTAVTALQSWVETRTPRDGDPLGLVRAQAGDSQPNPYSSIGAPGLSVILLEVLGSIETTTVDGEDADDIPSALILLRPLFLRGHQWRNRSQRSIGAGVPPTATLEIPAGDDQPAV